jgi:RimJ/RimL family protein N-acetyltransferase
MQTILHENPSPGTNEHGQPIGTPVLAWTPRALPPRTAMTGTRCNVVILDPAAHIDDLWGAFSADRSGRSWTYLFVDMPASKEALRAYLDAQSKLSDPLCHTIIEQASGRAVGIASFMRIDPNMGAIEVGNINYSERLKRTAIATEAMYLMMKRVFDELGYRRYEWKCDSLNHPSRKAAERYGYVYEGTFRQAVVYKGRNRDTAWFSIIDKEWPALKRAYETWLDPTNFDASGNQRRGLAELIAEAKR